VKTPRRDPFTANALRSLADTAAALDLAVRRAETRSRAGAAALRRARTGVAAAVAAMPDRDWADMLETVSDN
jgi:hypothetical protein